MNPTTFARRHPIGAYFALAYGIAWGGILLLVVRRVGIPGHGDDVNRLFPLILLMMLVGPSTAGLAMIATVQGRAGMRDLGARLTRWRVSWRWYLPLLTTAGLMALVLGVLTVAVSPEFTPGVLAAADWRTPVLFGLGLGLVAGFFEELGWTGFALPALRARLGLVPAGVTLGLLWGAWHVLGNYWSGVDRFGRLVYLDCALWVVALAAYRLLMAWVYEHTESVLLMQLMHASFTGVQGVLWPAASPAGNELWYALFAVGLWVLALTAVTSEVRWHPQARTPRPMAHPSPVG